MTLIFFVFMVLFYVAYMTLFLVAYMTLFCVVYKYGLVFLSQISHAQLDRTVLKKQDILMNICVQLGHTIQTECNHQGVKLVKPVYQVKHCFYCSWKKICSLWKKTMNYPKKVNIVALRVYPSLQEIVQKAFTALEGLQNLCQHYWVCSHGCRFILKFMYWKVPFYTQFEEWKWQVKFWASLPYGSLFLKTFCQPDCRLKIL